MSACGIVRFISFKSKKLEKNSNKVPKVALVVKRWKHVYFSKNFDRKFGRFAFTD